MVLSVAREVWRVYIYMYVCACSSISKTGLEWLVCRCPNPFCLGEIEELFKVPETLGRGFRLLLLSLLGRKAQDILVKKGHMWNVQG